MLKRFVLAFAVLLLCFTFAYAVPPVVITNGDGSTQAYVNKEALSTTQRAAKSLSYTGTGQIYSGTCNIQSIIVYGDTAGDSITVYDNANSIRVEKGLATADITADIEFEIGLSANTSSTFVDVKGVPFKYGIYVWASDATNTLITVVFDY